MLDKLTDEQKERLASLCERSIIFSLKRRTVSRRLPLMSIMEVLFTKESKTLCTI